MTARERQRVVAPMVVALLEEIRAATFAEAARRHWAGGRLDPPVIYLLDEPEENSLSERGPGCQKARHDEIGVPLLQPDTDHVHHADDLVRTRLAVRVMPPTSFDAARVGGEVQR